MHLAGTTALMEDMRSRDFLDSYAVLVHHPEGEALITSPDVNQDTWFDIASMGKVLITAPLILKAIGEGKAALNNTLPQFFANVPSDKERITLKDLLTHTSGIVRFEFPKECVNETHDQLAARILARPLAYPTGTDYVYSCHGYILLGFIAEKIWGNTLDTVF